MTPPVPRALFDCIEGARFANTINWASGLETAIRIAMAVKPTEALLLLMEDRQFFNAVEVRLAETAKKLHDPQHEYLNDAAAFTYLLLMDRIDRETARKAAIANLDGLVNGFWCRLLCGKWFQNASNLTFPHGNDGPA